MHVVGIDDSTVTKATKVEVFDTVHRALRAQRVPSLEAVVTVAARLVVVAPAGAVAYLEVPHLRTHLRDDTHTLVTEDHVRLAVVQVGTTQARVHNVDHHIVRAKLTRTALGLDDLAAGGSFEHCTQIHGG